MHINLKAYTHTHTHKSINHVHTQMHTLTNTHFYNCSNKSITKMHFVKVAPKWRQQNTKTYTRKGLLCTSVSNFLLDVSARWTETSLIYFINPRLLLPSVQPGLIKEYLSFPKRHWTALTVIFCNNWRFYRRRGKTALLASGNWQIARDLECLECV